jgi:hypothetical protein
MKIKHQRALAIAVLLLVIVACVVKMSLTPDGFFLGVGISIITVYILMVALTAWSDS